MCLWLYIRIYRYTYYVAVEFVHFVDLSPGGSLRNHQGGWWKCVRERLSGFTVTFMLLFCKANGWRWICSVEEVKSRITMTRMIRRRLIDNKNKLVIKVIEFRSRISLRPPWGRNMINFIGPSGEKVTWEGHYDGPAHKVGSFFCFARLFG